MANPASSLTLSKVSIHEKRFKCLTLRCLSRYIPVNYFRRETTQL